MSRRQHRRLRLPARRAVCRKFRFEPQASQLTSDPGTADPAAVAFCKNSLAAAVPAAVAQVAAVLLAVCWMAAAVAVFWLAYVAVDLEERL